MNVRAVDERPVMHFQLLHCPMAPDTDRSIFHVCELYQPGVAVLVGSLPAAARRRIRCLLTIPDQLGVDYCAHAIGAILTHVAPALVWR